MTTMITLTDNAANKVKQLLEAERVEGSDKPRIIPNERVVGTGLLKVVSTGMLVEDEGTALMWRRPCSSCMARYLFCYEQRLLLLYCLHLLGSIRSSTMTDHLHGDPLPRCWH